MQRDPVVVALSPDTPNHYLPVMPRRHAFCNTCTHECLCLMQNKAKQRTTVFSSEIALMMMQSHGSAVIDTCVQRLLERQAKLYLRLHCYHSVEFHG